MDVQKFGARVKHLNQSQILSGAVSSLNRLLVDKGIAKPEEIQTYFLQWMEEQNLLSAHKRSKKKQSGDKGTN